MCVCEGAGDCVGLRGQLCGVGSLLPFPGIRLRSSSLCSKRLPCCACLAALRHILVLYLRIIEQRNAVVAFWTWEEKS